MNEPVSIASSLGIVFLVFIVWLTGVIILSVKYRGKEYQQLLLKKINRLTALLFGIGSIMLGLSILAIVQGNLGQEVLIGSKYSSYSATPVVAWIPVSLFIAAGIMLISVFIYSVRKTRISK